MREIEFRGKDILHKKWHYGSLAKDAPQKSYYIIDENYGSGVDVDENTVGQYTGLRDKNGVKIFEGDIVEATYEFENNEIISKIEVVKCKLHKFILENRQKYEFEIEYFDYLKVIGNIYDNRELLEKGE